DLRGIEMLGYVLAFQRRLAGVVSDADKQKVESQLSTFGNAAAIIALAQTYEYLELIGNDPKSRASQVSAEPKSLNTDEMFSYYSELGFKITLDQMSTESWKLTHHMYRPYRIPLMLRAVGLEQLYEQRRAQHFKVRFPVRLYSFTLGSLQAIQSKCI